jgi:hypothetical protein
VPCQRGVNYRAYYFVTCLPAYLYFAVVVYSSIATYWTVRRIQTRQNRWAFNASNELFSSQLSIAGSSRRASATNNENVQQTLIQAMLYVATFFIAHIFYPVISFVNTNYVAVEENRNIYFPLVVLAKLCAPSLGFWNLFIYIRPRYYQLKKRNPEQSGLALLRKILLHSGNVDSGARPKHSFRRNNRQRPAGLSVPDQSGDADFTPELNLVAPERCFPRELELRRANEEKVNESEPATTIAETTESGHDSSHMIEPPCSHVPEELP